MAAPKRFLDDDSDHKPQDKRIRTTPTTTRPSFASIIGEVVMVKNMQNVFSNLEPLLRRVVTEEVERVMRHCYPPRSITRSPSLRIESVSNQPQSPRLHLMFTKPLSLPIFTGSRILDTDGNPIQVVLLENNADNHVVRTTLPQPIKLELVVLDGDFPPGDKDTWTTQEFNSHIVKERAGKRPLLTGELNLTMRDGIAPTAGDIEFTDNSSWIRSRKFRVAVRLAPGTGQSVGVREGITDAFMVKDHRGELYKKHHPPMLQDEVWRLEKIGKDGAFHKKLSSHSIYTVQDFLKLSVIDPPKLRKILGIGMSEKMWEVTMKHAKTCEMGNKLYVYRGSNFAIYLNPICQIIKAHINGILYWGKEISDNMNKTYIHKLWGEAYSRWGCLEEVDELLNDNIALLTQGENNNVEQFANNNVHDATLISTYDQNDFFGEKCSTEVSSSYGTNNNNAQININGGGCNEWTLNPTFIPTQFVNGISYRFSDSQSDGDITPSDHLAATTRWP